MALTEAEKGLIGCLKFFGVRVGTAMVVSMMLKEEDQQLDMMEYLLSKESVTDEEVLEMAHKIAD